LLPIILPYFDYQHRSPPTDINFNNISIKCVMEMPKVFIAIHNTIIIIVSIEQLKSDIYAVS